MFGLAAVVAAAAISVAHPGVLVSSGVSGCLGNFAESGEHCGDVNLLGGGLGEERGGHCSCLPLSGSVSVLLLVLLYTREYESASFPG